MGFRPEFGRRIPRIARTPLRRAPRALQRRRGAPPAALGRLPRHARRIRILARPPEPIARPYPLPPGRRKLDDRTAVALTQELNIARRSGYPAGTFFERQDRVEPATSPRLFPLL